MDFLNAALEASKKGCEILETYFGKLNQVEQKSSASDLVTIADRESERAIISHIKNAFPDHSFIGEETGVTENNKSYLWVIDPLDGTTNYTHQYPIFAVSIGLLIDNEPHVGVIENPITKELFFAVKGKGAFLNGKAVQVSDTADLTNSLLATGFAYDRLKSPETNYNEFRHFTQKTQGVRRAGAASLDLAYVACGRIDGYWERGLQIWDIAAGALIVEEAGGRVSAYDQSPLDFHGGQILATNQHIHKAISDELIAMR